MWVVTPISGRVDALVSSAMPPGDVDPFVAERQQGGLAGTITVIDY